MLSLVSSRYTLGLQLAFLTTNGAGITFGTMYNAKTPDLYPGNAHHSFGWIITCIISAQVMIRLATILIRRGRTQLHGSSEERPLFMRGLFKPREDFQQLHEQEYRLSQDSGQGSESRAESLRSSSASTVYDEQGPGMSSPYKELDDNVGNIGDLEDLGNLEAMPVASSQPSRVAAWFHRIASVGPSRWYKYVDQGLSVVDRVILPLGFAALATGVATYARFFVRFTPNPQRRYIGSIIADRTHRKDMASMVVWPTGSKEECSFGSVCSILVAGQGVSPSWAGLGMPDRGEPVIHGDLQLSSLKALSYFSMALRMSSWSTWVAGGKRGVRRTWNTFPSQFYSLAVAW